MEGRRKKILLVEDDGTLRRLYTDFLEREGFQVEHAVEGNEGYAKITSGGFDLILLDILLPGMQGQAILERLREASPLQPNGPIVMLTNQSEDHLLRKCRDLGAAGEIIKSNITPDTFIQRIRAFLTQKASPHGGETVKKE